MLITPTMKSKLIALDADGVLLNYNLVYADVWERAFGIRPALKDPLAYSHFDRWDVEFLTGARLEVLRSAFDHDFWSTVPALPGAVEACHRLVSAGYDLVCVSAVERRVSESRRQNLQTLGFPIETVIATGAGTSLISPKVAAIEHLKPCAFVDDFLPYFRGMPGGLHKALVRREEKGSPNVGPELSAVNSQHLDLPAFVDFWLQERDSQLSNALTEDE